MSKRLDPSGLAGAFAKDRPTALDFLVPPRPAEALAENHLQDSLVIHQNLL